MKRKFSLLITIVAATIVVTITVMLWFGFSEPTGSRVGSIAYTADGESIVVGFAHSDHDTKQRYTLGSVWRLAAEDFTNVTARERTKFMISHITPFTGDSVMITGTYCENKGGQKNVWSRSVLADFRTSGTIGTNFHFGRAIDSTGQLRGASVCAVSPDLRFWAFGSRSHMDSLDPETNSVASRVAVRQTQREESFWDEVSMCGPGHGVFPNQKQVDITSISFSPDSMQLVSGGEDALVKVWSLDYKTKQMNERLSLSAHQGSVVALAFVTPTSLASVDSSGRLIERDWPSGQVLKKAELALAHQAGPYGAMFAPDSKRLVVWGGGQVRLIDPFTHVAGLTLNKDANDASCAAFSPDGKRLAIGHASPQSNSAKGLIKEYDTTTGQQTQSREF